MNYTAYYEAINTLTLLAVLLVGTMGVILSVKRPFKPFQ